MNEEKNQNETKIEEVDKTPENKKEIDIASKQEDKTPPLRRILITTDGSNVNLVENQTVGGLELVAVLSSLLNAIQNRKQ